MNILAIDNSITSPGIIKCELDDNLDILSLEFLSFSSSKKWEMKDDSGEIISYKNKDYKGTQFSKIIMIHDEIIKFIGDTEYEYVAAEDYAFQARGQVFGLAESMGLLKQHFFNTGSKLRLYSIPSIKKFFTGKGNSDKIAMEETFDEDITPNKPELSFLPAVYDNKSGNPKDNIVDAYAIAQMLIAELKLRAGILEYKDLTDKQREVFLQSKGKEPNYPARDFICKN